jgi:membrane protease YdiL (CAAX protease family)
MTRIFSVINQLIKTPDTVEIKDDDIASYEINPDRANIFLSKTIITGVGVYALLGAQIACVCMVVSVCFTLISGNYKNDWFPLGTFKEKITKEISQLPFALFINTFYGLALSFMGVHLVQLPVVLLKEAFKISTFVGMNMLFHICVRAPIVEEIVFRGFLQDKIKDLQTIVFGKKALLNKIHKIVRITLQAACFGAMHYHPMQGASNIPIVVLTSCVGFICGFFKEEENSLVSPIGFHSVVNTSVSYRGLVFNV